MQTQQKPNPANLGTDTFSKREAREILHDFATMDEDCNVNEAFKYAAGRLNLLSKDRAARKALKFYVETTYPGLQSDIWGTSQE